MKKFILEACVDRVESAIIATRAGANRLELCSNLIIGGTTPTKALFEEVKKTCKNRIHVLIRPRFGDFCYSDYEFQICLKEVEQFRRLQADGIVIGILQPDGKLDERRMGQLIEAAGSMSITLHRAFDVCVDPMEAYETAKKLGIDTILTSGQKNLCLEGMDCIKQLVEKSHSDQRSGQKYVDILVGSGVKSQVIQTLYEKTRATSYHMSGKEVIESKMQYKKEDVHMGLDAFSEYGIWQTKEEEIERAVAVLQELEKNKN